MVSEVLKPNACRDLEAAKRRTKLAVQKVAENS